MIMIFLTILTLAQASIPKNPTFSTKRSTSSFALSTKLREVPSDFLR